MGAVLCVASARRCHERIVMLRCSVCGSRKWMAVRPGQNADPGVLESGVYVLHPAPAVPSLVWCLKHWPSRAVPKNWQREEA